MITNSKELSEAMKERSELEDKKKTKRLDSLEHERYIKLIYDISEYIANEDNLMF